MNLLLDTQIYLWAVATSPRLPPHTRELVSTADEVYVSAVSIWEACIKIALGKLDAPIAGIVNSITASGFTELPVLAIHVMGGQRFPRFTVTRSIACWWRKPRPPRCICSRLTPS